MASKCAGVKRNGSPCSATVTGPSRYCWLHAPENAAERQRIASKAGRSDGSHRREIQAVKAELRAIADSVVTGDLEPRNATAGVQALNTVLRAITLERELGVVRELEQRLRRIEEWDKSMRGVG